MSLATTQGETLLDGHNFHKFITPEICALPRKEVRRNKCPERGGGVVVECLALTPRGQRMTMKPHRPRWLATDTSQSTSSRDVGSRTDYGKRVGWYHGTRPERWSSWGSGHDVSLRPRRTRHPGRRYQR